jgi:hypothetical protein
VYKNVETNLFATVFSGYYALNTKKPISCKIKGDSLLFIKTNLSSQAQIK